MAWHLSIHNKQDKSVTTSGPITPIRFWGDGEVCPSTYVRTHLPIPSGWHMLFSPDPSFSSSFHVYDCCSIHLWIIFFSSLFLFFPAPAEDNSVLTVTVSPSFYLFRELLSSQWKTSCEWHCWEHVYSSVEICPLTYLFDLPSRCNPRTSQCLSGVMNKWRVRCQAHWNENMFSRLNWWRKINLKKILMEWQPVPHPVLSVFGVTGCPPMSGHIYLYHPVPEHVLLPSPILVLIRPPIWLLFNPPGLLFIMNR